MPQSWFAIRNKSADTAEIDLFDEIGAWGVTAKDFVSQLRSYSGLKQIVLNIDCPGGDCNDGFTIFDAIKAVNVPVTAHISGLAASMASVIMLAAQQITIAENGRVMIHRVTAGVGGNADDIEAAAKVARQFEDRIVKLYVERTKASESKVRDWMKAEMGTWFFGQEAIDSGFADSLVKGAKARAFKPEWAGLFTMLPAALFDTERTNNRRIGLIEDMKLTSEQKNRLHALLRKTDCTEAEKTELQTLSDQAKKEGYDAAAAILKEDEAAAAQKKKDEEAATLAKAVTPEMQKVIDSAVAAATKPLLDRVEKAETLIRAGVLTAAGGRTAVQTDTSTNENADSDEAKLAKEYQSKDTKPTRRSELLKQHGLAKLLAACNAHPEKKPA